MKLWLFWMEERRVGLIGDLCWPAGRAQKFQDDFFLQLVAQLGWCWHIIHFCFSLISHSLFLFFPNDLINPFYIQITLVSNDINRG